MSMVPGTGARDVIVAGGGPAGSAMAVMLRTLGIPSRVATGERANPVGFRWPRASKGASALPGTTCFLSRQTRNYPAGQLVTRKHLTIFHDREVVNLQRQ